MSIHVLTCHPSSVCSAIKRFEAEVLSHEMGFSVKYSIDGDLESIIVPEGRPPRRADSLWRTTCFEVFLKDKNGAVGYYEFNFSPSNEWAIYRFDAYRSGMAVVDGCEPSALSIFHTPNRLELRAVIDLRKPPMMANLSDACFALSSVIEDKQGRLSCWACAHPSEKPDFHHDDSFALRFDHVESF